jgi:hypothetical protein
VVAGALHARIGGSLDALEFFFRHGGGDDVQGISQQLHRVVVLVREPDAKHPSFFRRPGRLEYGDPRAGKAFPRSVVFEITICNKHLAHKAVW